MVESQILILYNIIKILVRTHKKPLRPGITYQVGIISVQQRHSWITLLTKQVVIDVSYPIKELQIIILPLTVWELTQGNILI